MNVQKRGVYIMEEESSVRECGDELVGFVGSFS